MATTPPTSTADVEALPPPALSDYEVPSPLPKASAEDLKAARRLDPAERQKIVELAKWAFIIGIACGTLWLKALLWGRVPDEISEAITAGKPAPKSSIELVLYDIVPVGAIIAAFFAAAATRFLAVRQLFPAGLKPVDAARDWVITGVVTGLVSIIAVRGFAQIPLLFVAAAIGVFLSRKLAVRQENVIGGNPVVQIGIQAVLVALFAMPFNAMMDGFIRGAPGVTWMAGVPMLLGITWAAVTISWAWKADQTLRRLQGGKSGRDLRYVARGGEAIEINLTILGGRESGKTVLLAGAYHEWMEQVSVRYGIHLQPISTMPVNYDQLAPEAQRFYLDRNLDYLAQQIYVLNQWPPSTQGMREFKFDVTVDLKDGKPAVKVARINLLDYPGSLLVTSDISADSHRKFWQRVADSDGLLFVADMSAMRRGQKEKDIEDVQNSFRIAMDVLMDGQTQQKASVQIESRIEGNGKNRVLPVGLVLTKCDECIDPTSGKPDHTLMDRLIYGESRARSRDDKHAAAVLYSGHFGLLQEWERKCRADGPGFAETEVFKTTAITASRPQAGPDGQPDYTRAFKMVSPADTHPTNCATPLLWMTAKALRWNVTTFTELKRWLVGAADTEAERQMQAIRKIERVIGLWQGAVEERRR